ncbi:hypothetical protein RHMOL_Rhmol01G0284100 [Rhododendron molle]|uniref:Uncharacterized protein n=1 Tax=Rhododendron molle TaxID=49168 RepID=A0ACC0Q8C1_RHOML|nr:hypothetical protein RHMOL_Rhmol01G0284100 [Rhododendron molle]
MPNSKGQRRGTEEKGRRGKMMGERASSFHGSSTGPAMVERVIIRPRTVPDLLAGGRRTGGVATTEEQRPRLTKLLLNVTIQRSLGAVQVVMSPESAVGDLIAAALRQYAKEGRRPILPATDPSGFDLHYSQFSLESLDREEKLTALGSRNFFLCPKKPPPAPAPASGGGGDCATAAKTVSCSKEAEKANKGGLPWLKFLSF